MNLCHRYPGIEFPERKYPAKILLLGEYTAILGFKALAVPYRVHSAIWKKSSSPFEASLDADFVNYLLSEREIPKILDISILKKILDCRVRLETSIPYGYGMGSSGSLISAIYDMCKVDNNTSISALKKNLALLESYFHSSSSGLDPLISYTNKVYIQDSGLVLNTSLNTTALNEANLFLIDSKMRRKTAVLVEHFKTQLKNQQFSNLIKDELVKMTEECIDSISIHADSQTFMECWKKISLFQFLHFKNMIPSNIIDIWKTGLASNKYYIKLCGAGGGGYFLGMDPGNFVGNQIGTFNCYRLNVQTLSN